MASASSHAAKGLHLQVPVGVIIGVGLMGFNLLKLLRFVAAA